MRRLLQNKLFVGLLVVVALAVIAQSLLGDRLFARARTVSIDAASTEEVFEENSDVAEETPEAPPRSTGLRSLKNWRALLDEPFPPRDPFLPRQPEVASPPATFEPAVELPQLQAVSHQGDKVFAVIDRRVVRAGDRLDAFVVNSIQRDSVTVSHAQKRTVHVLSLYPAPVSEPRPRHEPDEPDARIVARQ